MPLTASYIHSAANTNLTCSSDAAWHVRYCYDARGKGRLVAAKRVLEWEHEEEDLWWR